MKKDIVIKVEGLSKQYSIGKRDSYLTLRDKLMELPNKIFKREKKPTFWALKDVSFEVKRGEVLGVIGRNGAGKSTLLKILARITEPTTGKITMRGRVASMLEVGTGFNPELTGRENIYLNGSILGMSHKEIDTKFTEITDFAGIGKFLDTPVKHYSSGMYVRLAFAVAAHLDSDILLVDEVLAVGDAEFQKKCLGKMSDLSQSGKTVIFVSHNIAIIKSLCTNSIILDSGKSNTQGTIDQQYRKYISAISQKYTKKASIGDSLILNNISINPSSFSYSQKAIIKFEIVSKKQVTISDLALVISNPIQRVALLDFRTKGLSILHKKEKISIICDVQRLPLVEGDYHITIYTKYNSIECHLHNILHFKILASDNAHETMQYPAATRGVAIPEYVFSMNKDR